MNKPIKIGIIALTDPHENKNECSGTLHEATKAFERSGFETVWIRRHISLSFRLYNKCIIAINKIFHSTICSDRTYIGSWLNARAVDKNAFREVDYVFVIHHFFVPLWLNGIRPIIYHSDVTFELVNDYYLPKIIGFGKKRAEEIEKKALANTSIHLSPSYWRHQSVVSYYGISPLYAYVIPYGPCIDAKMPDVPKSISPGKCIKIFFSGVDWNRKGGDIAINVIEKFIQRGHRCELVIAGIRQLPQKYMGMGFIRLLGFLDKNKEKDSNTYIDEFRSSDIFFLPTKAEGAGIVFSEASSFGLPILTHDTGGIGSYVKNGVNGYRVPLDSPFDLYVDTLEKMIQPEIYSKLSVGALKMAKEELSWNLWTQTFEKIIK